MDGKYLAQGLLNATGDDLRLVYALVMETKMLDLLVAKSKDWFNQDLNHFEMKLQEEIVRLRDYSDEELQMKLFLYLLEQLDIKGAYFNLPAEIDFACEQVVQKTHALQKKQDKVYREFANALEQDYDATAILVQYQMRKIFESLDEGRAEMSEMETEQLADQISAFLDTLPEEKQQEIKEKLHIDELTNKTIQQLIATQGTAILMAIIVEVAGFAAFTTLTSAIATTVGLLGITLPFGAYMFATSAVSILTGPVGIALIAVGGGYLINWQNKKVRKTLLPIGVVQLLLPAVMEEAPVEYASFIALWNRLLNRQTEYKDELARIEGELIELREQKRGFEDKLVKAKKAILKNESDTAEWLKQIEAGADAIAEDEESQQYKQVTARMGMILTQIVALEQERERNAESSGFWNKVKGAVANTSLSSQVKKLQREMLEVRDEQTLAIVAMKPKKLAALCEKIETGWQLLAQHKQEKEWLEARIAEKQQDIQKVERAEKYARTDLKEFQKVWYGFSHID